MISHLSCFTKFLTNSLIFFWILLKPPRNGWTSFPGWSYNSSFRLQIPLLKSLLWFPFSWKIEAIFLQSSALHFNFLLQFTLLRTCPSLASLASLLSSDNWNKTSPQGICNHTFFCLKVPPPPCLHPSPFRLSLKGHPLTLHPYPSSYFIFFQSTPQDLHMSFLLIHWFCTLLQYWVNSIEVGFWLIHSSLCHQHTEKNLALGSH